MKNLTKLLEDMARAVSRANLTSGECQTCSEYCCTRLAREGGQGGGGREGRRERRRERGEEREEEGERRKGGGSIGEVEERWRKEEENVLVIITQQ